MSKRKFILLASLSVCAFVAETAQADISSSMHYIFKDVTLFNTLHTHLSLNGALSPQQVSKNQKSLLKVAQVCWIMDTGDCAGLDFVNSDIGNNGGTGGSGGGDEYDKKGPEDCIKEGYTVTNCPDGYKGDGECMYADGYYAKCVPDCPSSYTTCTSPYKGVGKVCGDGLYAECCQDTCGAEYQYTLGSIPDGYEVVGEPCVQCDGNNTTAIKKYRVKEKDCSGFLDCGTLGCEDGATTCQSGNQVKCSECKKCPNLGTESECPPCTVCTFEECSNLYVVSGCKTNCTDYCNYCASGN